MTVTLWESNGQDCRWKNTYFFIDWLLLYVFVRIDESPVENERYARVFQLVWRWFFVLIAIIADIVIAMIFHAKQYTPIVVGLNGLTVVGYSFRPSIFLA